MSFCLHSARVYQVEWDCGQYGLFNHRQEEVNRLIFKLCPNAFGNCEDRIYSDIIEVPKDEIKALIESVREDYEDCFAGLAKIIHPTLTLPTKEEVIDAFQRLLDHSDPRNNFVVLNWY